MMDNRQFEILRGQCLAIAARSFVSANKNLESPETRRGLIDLSKALLTDVLNSGYLSLSKKEFVQTEASTELRKKCSKCETLISANVAEYSERNFRQPLCIKCQKDRKP